MTNEPRQSRSLPVETSTSAVTPVLRSKPNEAGYPRVEGKCPACGSTGTLFLGSGGYVTCGLIGGRTSRGCPDPTAASKVLGAL
jgi:hypothetical protein